MINTVRFNTPGQYKSGTLKTSNLNRKMNTKNNFPIPSFQARLETLADIEKLRPGDQVILLLKRCDSGFDTEMPKRAKIHSIQRSTIFPSPDNSPCEEFFITTKDKNPDGTPIFMSMTFNNEGEKIFGGSIQVSKQMEQTLKTRYPLNLYYDKFGNIKKY